MPLDICFIVDIRFSSNRYFCLQRCGRFINNRTAVEHQLAGSEPTNQRIVLILAQAFIIFYGENQNGNLFNSNGDMCEFLKKRTLVIDKKKIEFKLINMQRQVCIIF